MADAASVSTDTSGVVSYERSLSEVVSAIVPWERPSLRLKGLIGLSCFLSRDYRDKGSTNVSFVNPSH